MNNRNEFAELIAIAHERLVMLDDLRAETVSLTWMSGFGWGVLSTLFTLGAGWGLWKWLH